MGVLGVCFSLLPIEMSLTNASRRMKITPFNPHEPPLPKFAETESGRVGPKNRPTFPTRLHHGADDAGAASSRAARSAANGEQWRVAEAFVCLTAIDGKGYKILCERRRRVSGSRRTFPCFCGGWRIGKTRVVSR